MNTYEITMTPLFYSAGNEELIQLYPHRKVRVKGTKTDFVTGAEVEFFVVKNHNETVFWVPSHVVRECRVVPRKKAAKVLRQVADKEV
jgi:hypothetical protein